MEKDDSINQNKSSSFLWITMLARFKNDFIYMRSVTFSHFVWWSGTIYAILVDGWFGNIRVKYFLNLDKWFRRGCRLKEKFTA